MECALSANLEITQGILFLLEGIGKKITLPFKTPETLRAACPLFDG